MYFSDLHVMSKRIIVTIMALKTYTVWNDWTPSKRFFTDNNRTKGIDLFFLFCLFVCSFFTLSLICKLGWPFCTKLYGHKTLVFLIQKVILINIPLFQSYNNAFSLGGEVPWPEAVPDFSVIITWIWTCFSKSAHSIGQNARWIFTSLRRNLNNQTSRGIWRFLDANWQLRKMP